MTSLVQWAVQNPLLAPVYEHVYRPAAALPLLGFDLAHVRHEQQRTVEALRLAPGSTVLDVACGPGLFTRRFARAVEPGGLAVGIDLSAPMLAQAVRRSARVGGSR